MERRREQRIPVDQDVVVTLLGSDQASFTARTVDQSGRGLQILLAQPLEAGAAVKIEMEDALLLAEVCFINAVPAGFVAGLRIDQMLSGLTDLSRLNKRLGFDQAGVAEEDDKLVPR